MLGKVLGIVTAGVFVGAAAVEISGHWARDRTDEEQDEQPRRGGERVNPDVEASKEHDKAVPHPSGAEVDT